MLQEDTINDLSFEIIEDKDSSSTPEKQQQQQQLLSLPPPPPTFTMQQQQAPLPSSGGLSPTPNPYSQRAATTTTGNPWAAAAVTGGPVTASISTLPPPVPLPPQLQPFPTAVNIKDQGSFSAAIPPSKGLPISAPVAVEATSSSTTGGGGLFGILSKVAEKAKSSVDSIITTLDPQMGEFIHSTGVDVKFIVLTQNAEESEAIRDAIYSHIGNATIRNATILETQTLSVGLEEGFQTVTNRIKTHQQASSSGGNDHAIFIAVENTLIRENQFVFDINIVMLVDITNQLTLNLLSQTTPVPVEQFLKQADLVGTRKDIPTDNRLGLFLKLKPNWQEYITGVSRKEIIRLATKALIKMYKDHTIT